MSNVLKKGKNINNVYSHEKGERCDICAFIGVATDGTVEIGIEDAILNEYIYSYAPKKGNCDLIDALKAFHFLDDEVSKVVAVNRVSLDYLLKKCWDSVLIGKLSVLIEESELDFLINVMEKDNLKYNKEEIKEYFKLSRKNRSFITRLWKRLKFTKD